MMMMDLPRRTSPPPPPRCSGKNKMSSYKCLGILIVAALSSLDSSPSAWMVEGFSPFAITTSRPSGTTSSFTPWSSLFMAKKKVGTGTSGAKGFGKKEAPPASPMEDVALAIDKSTSTGASPVRGSDGSVGSVGLKSVPGGSSAKPQIDDSIPIQDRTQNILREQYGLRTREEQEQARRKLEQSTEQRKKLQEWKKMADEGQDFDLMKMLPEPVLIFVDRFLKVGVAICTVLFVVAGGFITVEAYSKTTGNPLPVDLDKFIVEIVEPNFTPGLGVLLGFSVSLGAFAAAQLSSASSTYKEDR